jgi:hypothetical protein
MQLKASTEERDTHGARRMSDGKGNVRHTPQGGDAGPLLANISSHIIEHIYYIILIFNSSIYKFLTFYIY